MDLRTFGRKLIHKLWSSRGWVILATAIIVFLALLEDVLGGEVLRFDAHAYQLIVVGMRNPTITPIMQGISELASPVVILAMLLMVAAFAPGKRPGRCATLNLVCVFVLNQVLKNLIQRPRPDGFRLVSEIGYSFPSGHSMISMAFYGLCVWMVWHYERDRIAKWHYERDRIAKWLYYIGFSLLIALVGISRIYLGVHYASDVLAGFCVSLAWLVFYTKVICPLMLPEEPRAQRGAASPGKHATGTHHNERTANKG